MVTAATSISAKVSAATADASIPARVTPTCTVERKRLGCAVRRAKILALRSPSSAILASLASLRPITASSLMAKNALLKIRNTNRPM